MEVKRSEEGHGDFILTFDKDEIEDLADPIIGKAKNMSRTLLDLGYVLREAQYSMRDNFRQPPNAFTADAPKQPSVEG
jgi:type IV secretory pathway ATPase VirB11/archaellum biosynthesis ATPase